MKRVWYIQGKGVNFHSICWQEKAIQEKDVPIDWYIYMKLHVYYFQNAHKYSGIRL